MPASVTDNKASSTFVAFMPRQVLLGMKQSSDNNGSSNGTVQSKQEEKVLLHHSIAYYLQRCGFSKTLKKFRSEAQIEKDNEEVTLLDLEEMCPKYLELCQDAKTNMNYQKKRVAGKQSKKDGEDNLIADMDNVSKKNKKKSDKSDIDAVVHQYGTHESFKGSKNSEEKDTDKMGKEKKKKSKLSSESLAKSVEDNQLESQTTVTEVKLKDNISAGSKTVNGAETVKKPKDKKTKKDKPSCDGDAKEPKIENLNEIVSKKDIFETSNDDVADKKRDSKKRKRPTSEENDLQLLDRKADEEPKRRKMENLNESKGGEQSAKTNANLGSDLNSNKENIGASGQVDADQLQKTYSEQLNWKTNGYLENPGERSSVQRSKKKQGSVEQKAAKAFQRVKIEEVQYSDKRLQDNSYWAKDGADIGYGAKAEEILGQVRGR